MKNIKAIAKLSNTPENKILEIINTILEEVNIYDYDVDKIETLIESGVITLNEANENYYIWYLDDDQKECCIEIKTGRMLKEHEIVRLFC